ncbi:MFS transporter, partial [Tropicimonas sp.]|uniref:MFS transporter n=1 Tax=Tropicimonas sp. TaxID=2067044 RepID=UPI003A87649D
MPESTRLLAVVCVVFFTVGMSQGAIGPALPDLARQTGSNLVAAGGSLTAIYLFALVGQTGAGLLIKRLGYRAIFLAGMTAFVIGTSGIAASTSLTILLSSAGCLGLSVGMVLLTGNVVAAEASVSAGPLNLVNAVFGVGAILAPALVSASMVTFGTGVLAIWTIPCVMAGAACLLLFWMPRPSTPQAPDGSGAPAGRRRLRSVAGSPTVWIMGIFMIGYMAQEVGISAWLPTILNRAMEMPLSLGAIAASLFWLLMTLARFGAVWVSRYAGPHAILRHCIRLCILGGALLLAGSVTGHQALGWLAVTALGVALGPILPTMLSIARTAFPDEAGMVTGMVIGIANIGGA